MVTPSAMGIAVTAAPERNYVPVGTMVIEKRA